MAQSVETVYIDDLDNSQIDPAEATTVQWSWRGVDYEFDTRADTLTALESDTQTVSLALLLASSRRVGGRQHAARPIGGTGGRPQSATAAVREWAREQGLDVPDRGRVPQAVHDAYEAAH